MRDPFTTLPIDILRLVGSYLEEKSLLELCKASDYVDSELSSDPVLWNNYLKRDFLKDARFEEGEEARALYLSLMKDLENAHEELELNEELDAIWLQLSTRKRVLALNESLDTIVRDSYARYNRPPLILMSYKNKTTLARYLIGRPDVDINSFDDAPDLTALRSAVFENQIDLLQALLREPTLEVNSVGISGYTPLHTALDKSHLEIAKALLSDPRVNRHAVTKTRKTTLRIAVEKGDSQIINTLISDPTTDLNVVDLFDMTALMVAVERDNLAAANQLISLPLLDVNKADYKGRIPLMQAAYRGQVSVVQGLLARDDINLLLEDNEGISVLWHAVMGGRLEVIQSILDKAQEINQAITPLEMPDQLGLDQILHYLASDCSVDDRLASHIFTPLCHETFRKRTAIIHSIFTPHPDININLSQDPRANVYEFASQCDPRLLPLLYSIPDIHLNQIVRTREGMYSALLIATQRGRSENVAALLTMEGIDVNDSTLYGLTALSYATDRWHPNINIIRALLNHPDIDINAQDNNGYTPLMNLVMRNHASLIREFVAHPKIDVNRVDRGGYTALMHAARAQIGTVRALLTARGINFNARNHRGWTAMEVTNDLRIKILLRSHAAAQSLSTSVLRFSQRPRENSPNQSSSSNPGSSYDRFF